MGHIKDIKGQQFGRLVAIEPTAERTRNSMCVMWLCQCNCGRYLLVSGTNLRYGNSTQCSICARNTRRSRFVGSDGK